MVPEGRRHATSDVQAIIEAALWSPEQIARRLPVDVPDEKAMRISHEAIYQALFIQGVASCAAN